MKMKRILSVLTAAAVAMQITAAVSAADTADAAGTVRAEVDYDRARVTVSGTTNGGGNVLIEVIKPSVTVDLGNGETEYTIPSDADPDTLPAEVQEKMLDHFEAVKSENGGFGTAYVSDGKPGVYTVRAKGGADSAPAAARFYLDTKANAAAMLETVNGYINGKNKTELGGAFSAAKDSYLIGAAHYDDSIRDGVAAGVISEGAAESMSELVKRVEKYSIIQRLRAAVTDAEAAALISGYAEELGISETDEYKYMLNATAAFKTELGKRVRSAAFEAYAQFESAFKSAACLSGVHNATNYGEINGILNRAKKAGFLTDSAYFKQSSTKSVDTKLLGKDYADMDALEKAIKSFISSGNSNSGGTGGGSGSGGSSGGSGGTNVSIGTGAVKPNNQTAAAFSDVDESHWAYLSILSLKKAGSINGYADGTFKPDNNVTRSEFLKIALDAFGITDDGAKSTFADVSESDWCYKWIAAAQTNGIISGDEYGRFGGDTNITRQDVAKILYGILKFKSSTLPAEREYTGFADYADIADYAEEAVEALYRGGAINGIGDGRFMPKAYATRAETAKMVFSVLQKIGG